MSSRGKVSAYAVFKGRKSSSLSNVTATGTPNVSNKSISANTTPTNTSKHGKISSFLKHITQSEKKKAKKERSKAKKSMREAEESSLRLSVTSENSGQSNNDAGSLRSKSAAASRGLGLPLKANAPENLDLENSFQAKSVKSSKKRRSTARGSPKNTPETAKTSKKRTAVSGEDVSNDTARDESSCDVDGAKPPKPAKRPRISAAPISPTPSYSPILKDNVVLSPGKIKQLIVPMPAPPSDEPTKPYMFNSQDEARKLFECLLHPVKVDKFFLELWEKKPLLVKRHTECYNEGWFSCAELDRILRENTLNFTENLDVVQYVNDKRETLNPIGRAHASVVWDFYQNGCSVRILNPQTYSRNIWKLLSNLQEYFGCMVGANLYLTPPSSQGFAPHYDDIEAFILQLEGKKHWRLYSPRSDAEKLPRFSSGNFSQADMEEPILDVVLEAGDLLYFPRGTIHQGRTLDDHSLHITISCMQQNSWGDFFEKMIPRALQIAFEEDIEFRKSLPRDYLNYMGVAFSDVDCPQRQHFLRKVEKLMSRLMTYAPVDGAADQMAKKYIHDSLPPVLTENEKLCSIHQAGERWDPVKKRVTGATELQPDDEIKIIRKGCVRIVSEDEEKVCIYHNLENQRTYHKVDLQYIEIAPELAGGVEFLLQQYPEFVRVEDLPVESLEEKIELASVLYDKGLVVTRQPMEMVSSSECESSEEATSSVENRAPVASSKKKQVRKQVSKRKMRSSAANKSSNV